MKTVSCDTMYGGKKEVPVDALSFRPAVYAIITTDSRMVVLGTRHTGSGRYSLPGGSIEVGEPIEAALRREVHEETGLEIKNITFFRFVEQFFYYDPADVAFHSFRFYYLCNPASDSFCSDDEVNDDEVEGPRWADIATLTVKQFHDSGELIMAALSSLEDAAATTYVG